MNDSSKPELKREIGVFGATMMGMGSIIGTGVFVSIGIAADVAGTGVLLAIFIASLVAICNGLSSAQLAANHPVSGGTYEYGYRWLSPRMGFTAGWMFLCAKSASAATAGLGFAGYLLNALDQEQHQWIPLVAILALGALTIVAMVGIHRSSKANIAIVSVTLLSLSCFVIAGLPQAFSNAKQNLLPVFGDTEGAFGILQATALMFVAYTGYGRIATLGEEVKEPRRTIPRAVIATLIASMVLYLSVAFVALASVGAVAFGESTKTQMAPLQVIASGFAPAAGTILAVGAMTSMLGVLLNLLLGLSRVVFAMARRGDMPKGLAAVNATTGVPWMATLAVAILIGGLIAIGDVKLTWSFSAFTVLIYYALTNLCVLKLPPDQRLFPVWPAWCGLASCVFLAFWVGWAVWLAGMLLIGIGLIWHQTTGLGKSNRK